MEINKSKFFEKTYVYFDWSITRWCNYQCSYCHANNSRDRSAYTKNYDDVIDKLQKVKEEFKICITGGEPSYHPDFKDIIAKLLPINNLVKINLFTNMSKPIEFYEDLMKLDNSHKIDVMYSYHPEYHNDTIKNKILKLNKVSNLTVQIMIHDREQYWDVQEDILKFVKDNNITYNPTFIRSTRNHLVLYVNKFKERFKKYFVESDVYEYLDITYVDGSIGKMKMDDALFEKQTFKDFHCEAKSWTIKTNGDIVNTCTNEPWLNESKMRKCPNNICQSTVMLEYTKEKL